MDTSKLPLVGKKFLNQLEMSNNDSIGSELSEFAKKQMAKMGWSTGKGLGKTEQGITTHVKVKKKRDNSGVRIYYI